MSEVEVVVKLATEKDGKEPNESKEENLQSRTRDGFYFQWTRMKDATHQFRKSRKKRVENSR